MEKSIIVLALFLLVGATKINGDLEAITPPDVDIRPIFESRVPPPEQINGRLLTQAEGCGLSSMGVPRVVGGGPARNGAYPWMALLGYCDLDLRDKDYGRSFRCGGSLITSRHVLTAAHCLDDNLWFARLGEHDYRHTFDGDHQDVEIISAIGHERYDRPLIIYDVAVLLLKQDVVYNDRIRPVCLPIDGMRSYSLKGSNPFVAGWGHTGDGKPVSPYLKHLQLPHMDTHACKNMFLKVSVHDADKRINDATVCAGGAEGQGCYFGDSGGPLFLPVNHGKHFHYYQFGVVSWVLGCAVRYIPAVFQSTQYFTDWIQSIIASNHVS